jgi:hypothetical protein
MFSVLSGLPASSSEKLILKPTVLYQPPSYATFEGADLFQNLSMFLQVNDEGPLILILEGCIVCWKPGQSCTSRASQVQKLFFEL